MFRSNVGGIDKVLRLAFGGILFFGGLLLLASKIRSGVILAVVGLLALVTGLVRFCVLYVPFGISTTQPERPLFNQVCNCAAWKQTIHNNRIAVAPPAPPREESAEAGTATRGR